MLINGVFIALLSTVYSCYCLNILVLFPCSGKSHILAVRPLFKKLISRGHNITILNFYPQDENITNYNVVDLTEGYKVSKEGSLRIDQISVSKMEMYTNIFLLAKFGNEGCAEFSSNTKLHIFLKQYSGFDLLIVEYFNKVCQMGITKIIKAPVIGFSTCVNPPWVNSMFGASNHPAYIPNVFLDHSDKKTFLQRLEATIFLGFNLLFFKFFLSKPGNEYSKQYFGVDVLQDNLMYNASLLLTNTHYSFNRPKPLPPNVIEVAGIHIEEAKQFPENFQKFLDDSPQGVIYMSMGSMLKGTSFPKEKRKIFQKVFSSLSQRVIWKWENNTMEEKSNNLMITKWAPQRDILCHPNVRAFISHGGLLGTLEAIYCGVPIIVMPQFGDQHANAAAIEVSGGGIKLELSEVTEEGLYSAIIKILVEESRLKARELSNKFKDRPLSPMDTAIYWIEYVARHKGAKFLRTTATEMPFYQYFLLDVFGFLIVAISAFFYSIYSTINFVRYKFFIRNPKLKTN